MELVRNSWFHLIHLCMIGVVVVEPLLSVTCPLTTLESYLRSKSGQTSHSGSFHGQAGPRRVVFRVDT
ncbi:MAG: DUF2784 family protein [Pirellulaceae bacterium]|nr:DUF2784 family protein [Pirellulaceae bacterium]